MTAGLPAPGDCQWRLRPLQTATTDRTFYPSPCLITPYEIAAGIHLRSPGARWLDSCIARADRARRGRPEISRRSALARLACQRPRPARGRSGPGEDADGQDPCGGDPNRLSAAAIHPRPAPGRSDRNTDLQSALRGVHDEVRSALLESAPRR